MLAPPKFEVPLPTSTKLIEGTVNHQMSCLVRGNPLPTVEWFKNDVNIDTSADYIITFNNGLAVLKFGEVILEDEGIYTCRAANKAGEEQSSSELLVEGKDGYIYIFFEFSRLFSNSNGLAIFLQLGVSDSQNP